MPWAISRTIRQADRRTLGVVGSWWMVMPSTMRRSAGGQ
jgi:hypothetical protein